MQANNPTLTRILAHPRVREIRPQWYGKTCDACGGNGHYKGFDASGRWAKLHCFHCHGIGKTNSHIPDLARPDQLHELLGLADDLCKPPHLANVEWNIGDEEFCAHFNSYCGYGQTRADAVIAAIARALNIGDAE